MSAIQNTFQVYKILNNVPIITAKQLSNMLGCSVRQIMRYIDELSIAGVPICSARGNKGGFYISHFKYHISTLSCSKKISFSS